MKPSLSCVRIPGSPGVFAFQSLGMKLPANHQALFLGQYQLHFSRHQALGPHASAQLCSYIIHLVYNMKPVETEPREQGSNVAHLVNVDSSFSTCSDVNSAYGWRAEVWKVTSCSHLLQCIGPSPLPHIWTDETKTTASYQLYSRLWNCLNRSSVHYCTKLRAPIQQ